MKIGTAKCFNASFARRLDHRVDSVADFESGRKASVEDRVSAMTCESLQPRYDDFPQVMGGRKGLLPGYGILLGVLLAGNLLFDKAFAYIHVPGTPLYVAELFILFGAIAVASSPQYLSDAIRREPLLALLLLFVLWGAVRLLPDVSIYGINAIRDAALWYYCSFAFIAVAVLAKCPDMASRWLRQLDRFLLVVFIWLPIALVARSYATAGPDVPFSSMPILTHKSQDIVIVPVLGLGYLWLQPSVKGKKRCAFLSLIAFLIIIFTGTQTRGGLLSGLAGLTVGLIFADNRLRIMVRGALVVVACLVMTAMLSLQISTAGTPVHAVRTFSAGQLLQNVASISGTSSPGFLSGTVAYRESLWTTVLSQQVEAGRLLNGFGFGLNLANQAGVYDGNYYDPLRSPHNSYLDVLARMGVVGIVLWVALWTAWYWRLVSRCKVLRRRGLGERRCIAVLCLMVNTAYLVGAFFDPAFEGAMAAVIAWTAFGVGVAVTRGESPSAARSLTV